MNPFITAVVLTVLVISGVWGSLIISGLLKRRQLKPGTPLDNPRIEELREDHHRLEVRLARLEEEVRFLRELRSPKAHTQLPPSESMEDEFGG
jgi:hypothetical protein